MGKLDDEYVVDVRDYECLHTALADFADTLANSAKWFIKESGIKDPDDIAKVTELHDQAAAMVQGLAPKLAKLDRKILFVTAELQGMDGAEVVADYETSYPLLLEDE